MEARKPNPLPKGTRGLLREERPLEELSPGRYPVMSNTLPLLASSWSYCYQLGMTLQEWQREGEVHSPASETLALSADLEVSHCITNLFLPNRGLQTHAGWLPLLPRRRLAFPASCEHPVPASWKSASWSSFLRDSYPWAWGHRPIIRQ